jgi:hypothetical protein
MLFDDIGEFCYLCGVSFIQHMEQYSPKYFGKILKLLRHVRAAHSLDLNEPPSSNCDAGPALPPRSLGGILGNAGASTEHVHFF